MEKSLNFTLASIIAKPVLIFFFYFGSSSSKLQLWYALAKTLSEQAAWALAMDRMVNMVSINAGLVLGPGVTQQNSRSTMSYLQGRDVLCCNIIHFVTWEQKLIFTFEIIFKQVLHKCMKMEYWHLLTWTF